MIDKNSISQTITIDRPMVLIPLEEYRELLVEAGRLKTPILDREIAEARKRFKEGKAKSWEKLKNELR
jgi:hypothetical protein